MAVISTWPPAPPSRPPEARGAGHAATKVTPSAQEILQWSFSSTTLVLYHSTITTTNTITLPL